MTRTSGILWQCRVLPPTSRFSPAGLRRVPPRPASSPHSELKVRHGCWDMGAHAARQMRILAATGDASIDTWVDGATSRETRAWLGMARPQPAGDRRRLLPVGGRVPATDLSAILSGVAWGSARVCEQVLGNLRRAGIDGAVMQARSDIDLQEDLPAWETVKGAWTSKPPSLGVVIPAFNEARMLRGLLARVLAEADEVIVVDGWSDDGSAQMAREAGARVVLAE